MKKQKVSSLSDSQSHSEDFEEEEEEDSVNLIKSKSTQEILKNSEVARLKCDQHIAELLQEYLKNTDKGKDQLEKYVEKKFLEWLQYLETNTYILEQNLKENVKSFQIEYEENKLFNLSIECFKENTQEKLLKEAIEQLSIVQLDKRNIIYNYLPMLATKSLPLPKKIPFFTNHRPLLLEAVISLLINFARLILHKNLCFTFLKISQDNMVIIDGSHRFVAIMIWKGITPANYENMVSKFSEEMYDQIHVPPVIHPLNLNFVTTSLNVGAEATLKENFIDLLRGFRTSILLTMRDQSPDKTLQPVWPTDVKEVLKYLGNNEVEKTTLLLKAIKVLHCFCKLGLWDRLLKINLSLSTDKYPSSTLNTTTSTNKNKSTQVKKLSSEHFPASVYYCENKQVVETFLDGLYCNSKLLPTKKCTIFATACHMSYIWNNQLKTIKPPLILKDYVHFEKLPLDAWEKFLFNNRGSNKNKMVAWSLLPYTPNLHINSQQCREFLNKTLFTNLNSYSYIFKNQLDQNKISKLSNYNLMNDLTNVHVNAENKKDEQNHHSSDTLVTVIPVPTNLPLLPEVESIHKQKEKQKQNDNDLDSTNKNDSNSQFSSTSVNNSDNKRKASLSLSLNENTQKQIKTKKKVVSKKRKTLTLNKNKEEEKEDDDDDNQEEEEEEKEDEDEDQEIIFTRKTLIHGGKTYLEKLMFNDKISLEFSRINKDGKEEHFVIKNSVTENSNSNLCVYKQEILCEKEVNNSLFTELFETGQSFKLQLHTVADLPKQLFQIIEEEKKERN